MVCIFENPKSWKLFYSPMIYVSFCTYKYNVKRGGLCTDYFIHLDADNVNRGKTDAWFGLRKYSLFSFFFFIFKFSYFRKCLFFIFYFLSLFRRRFERECNLKATIKILGCTVPCFKERENKMEPNEVMKISKIPLQDQQKRGKHLFVVFNISRNTDFIFWNWKYSLLFSLKIKIEND